MALAGATRGVRLRVLLPCCAVAFAVAGVTAGGVFGGEAKTDSRLVAAAKGTLRMSATPNLTLDPPNAPGESDLIVLHAVYQRLVGYDFAKARVIPELARSWKISNGGKTYTFQLDPKARFASGNPVTAADVKYSLDRVLAYTAAVQGFQIAPYLTKDAVTAVGARTVRINLAAPAPAFLSALTGTAASILDSKVVQSHVSGDDLAKGWLSANAAGSGPFAVSSWVKDSHLTLRRNTRYWGPRPSLNTVQLQYVASGPQAVSLLKGGDLDVLTSALPRDVKSLQRSGYQIVKGPNLFTYYISLNEDSKWPFRSADVRRAVKYAIDYDGLTKQLLGGTAVRAGGVIGQGLLGYDQKLNSQYKTDIEKAKALMKKAGFSRGFTIEMYYQNNAPVNGVPADTIAAKLQADLQRIGIKLTLRGQPSATVFPQYRSGALPMVFWFFGPTYPDPDVIMSPHGDYNTQATTRVHYRNTTVTKLIREARVTVNLKKREQLYKRAQALVAQNGPYAFLFRPLAISVARKGVKFAYVPIWTVDLAKSSAG